MTDSVSTEKKEEKQTKPSLKDDARLSKRQVLAIWAALVTALGSQGIPAIVTALENKPDVADVQEMIAQQTTKLTEQQNNAVEVIKELHEDVKGLQETSKEVARLSGLVDMLRELVRDCCRTRNRNHRRPAVHLHSPSAKPKDSGNSDAGAPPAYMPPMIPDALVDSITKTNDVGEKSSKVDKLKKVPEFDPNKAVQQQVQIQEPRK